MIILPGLGLTVSSSEGYWVKEEDYVIKGFHYEGKSWVTAAPSKGYYNAIEKVEREGEEVEREREIQTIHISYYTTVPWAI